MDLAILANLGEAIGGIAVLVSLVYLSIQIRANTKTVRAANYGDLLTVANQFSLATLDRDTASIWVSGLADFDGLDPEDQVRFHGLMSLLCNAVHRACLECGRKTEDSAGLELEDEIEVEVELEDEEETEEEEVDED